MSERHKAEDELCDLLIGPPRRGSWWQHVKSEGSYVIEGRAIRESDHTPVVLYRRVMSGVVWSRPVAEFLERFRPHPLSATEEPTP